MREEETPFPSSDLVRWNYGVGVEWCRHEHTHRRQCLGTEHAPYKGPASTPMRSDHQEGKRSDWAWAAGQVLAGTWYTPGRDVEEGLTRPLGHSLSLIRPETQYGRGAAGCSKRRRRSTQVQHPAAAHGIILGRGGKGSRALHRAPPRNDPVR